MKRLILTHIKAFLIRFNFLDCIDHKWFCFVEFSGFLRDPVEIKDTNLKSHLELQVLTFILSADNTTFMIICSKVRVTRLGAQKSYHIGSLLRVLLNFRKRSLTFRWLSWQNPPISERPKWFCSGFGWDIVNILSSSWRSAVLWL